MPALSYLHRHPKTGMYWFRRAVPPDLRPIIGKREIKKSLATKNVTEAKRLAPVLMTEVDRVFADAKRKANPEAVSEVADADLQRMAQGWFASAVWGNDEANLLGAEYTPDLAAEELTGFDDVEAVAKSALGMNDLKMVETAADAILADHAVRIPKDGRSYKVLSQYVLRAVVEGIRQARAKLQGDYGYTPRDPLFKGIDGQRTTIAAAHATASTASGSGETLSTVLKSWATERKPPKKTADEWERAVRRWRDLHGDLPLAAITVAHVSAYKDTLLQAPSRAPQAIAKLPLLEQVEAAKANPKLPRVSELRGIVKGKGRPVTIEEMNEAVGERAAEAARRAKAR